MGRTAIIGAAQGFMTAFPDLVVAMDGVELHGDRAVYRWTLTGTNTGPGVPARLCASAATRNGVSERTV